MQSQCGEETVCFKYFWGMVALLLLCISLPSGASGNLRFEHLALTGEVADKNDNLSAVRATVKDRRGFVWFGGENGLGRYDSQNLKIYQTEYENPKSISANFIWALVVDHDGVMWIGTGRGLNRYNADTDDFDRFFAGASGGNTLPNNAINSLAVDRQNNLIIGTANGLSVLDAQRKHFKNYFPHPDGNVSSGLNLVRKIFVDSKDRVWVGTSKNGLNLFDRESGKFTSFLNDPQNPNSLSSDDVAAIGEDAHGQLWVGTYGQGLNRMHADGKSFTRYRHNRADSGSLASDNATSIVKDKHGNLWIATDHGGLNLYLPETENFRRSVHSAYDPNSLSTNNPRNLYEDDQSNLWIGMFPTGVNFLDQSTTVFANYSHKPDTTNSLSGGGILSFLEDSGGMLWIGTENGLNAFDQKTKTVTRYFTDDNDESGFKLGAVLTIEEDKSGDLWLGTWSGGLHRFSRGTGELKTYMPVESDPKSLNDRFVWKVLRDKEDNIWLATENGGINRYHPETDSFTHYMPKPGDPHAIVSNEVWTIMEDSKGFIWVATLGGLDRFDKTAGKFTHFLHNPHDPKTISSNQIISLMEDSRGKIWIGTRDAGVNIYDPATNSLSFLTVADGLPSATISSIIEDNQRNIWVTTVNGIARIEPGTRTIKSFNRSHGLVSNNFNRDATFKDKQGNLYVGSIGGFSVFDPTKIVLESTAPPVVITDFRLLNRSVAIGGADGLLQKSIVETRKLTLSYKHTMFSFDFAALGYRSPSNNKYAYMLEGFDGDWHHIGNQHSATYTNISPGSYVFKVKAANKDGVWNETGAAIELEITPPFWRTWWAYLAYAVTFIDVVYMINKYKNMSIKTNIYRILSATDPLTGIYNRAGLAQVIEALFSRRESREGISLLVFDIDHFKMINDTRGHDTGDRVLKEFTELVTRSVRAGDTFGRWGGEEFILLCVNSSREGVIILAEKIRHLVANNIFDKEVVPFNITVSIGIACAQPGESFDALFKRADLKLYEAKSEGRNKIMIAS